MSVNIKLKEKVEEAISINYMPQLISMQHRVKQHVEEKKNVFN
jgi:hypothetical protein